MPEVISIRERNPRTIRNAVSNSGDFRARTKKAMDMIMYNSVSVNMAVAANATSAEEAMKMLKHIRENL